jgi:hypothetical protein
MGLKEIVNSDRGKIVLALLLGFGLSTFFRKECKDDSCLVFRAPPLDKVNGQIFEYNTKCYKFTPHETPCSKTKKIVKIDHMA